MVLIPPRSSGLSGKKLCGSDDAQPRHSGKVALVESEKGRSVFEADGGDEDVLHADVLVLADEMGVYVGRPPCGSFIERQNCHASEECLLPDLLPRASHAEERSVYGAGAGLLTSQERDEGARV